MAELVLSTLGSAIGARLAPVAFRAAASIVGQVAGAALGRGVDQRLFGETRRIEGPRLTELHVQASSEGASIPAVFGRVRIAGQVIWAARFKEHVETSEQGGKGGPRVRSTEYSYTLSFAVGLCEGVVSRIGRAWANGEPLDLSQVTWRLHRGEEDQDVDPLIEAVEGAHAAPAYRGLAYIVFEDLPLERFGDAVPQLSFEIVRPPAALDGARLEQRVRGVCMIPGSGEFVYATQPMRRKAGPGQESAENVHAEKGRADFLVALDQLGADLPNCETVMLVVSWFGTDLRCGQCQIRPGVERLDKATAPLAWSAGGVGRDGAHVVSQIGGAPAFGGTPTDASVVAAIAELKARGYKVGLYPFILMDLPPGNALPDPYGGAEQGAYPWRGRITVHPAPGQPGTPDKTGAAATQTAALIGAASAADFTIGAGAVSYAGPDEWSLRRFLLHIAALGAAAGGVDAFVIGSELAGLTRVRDSASTFPVVTALQSIAAEARSMLGGATTITYAADWSEYFGHQPQDGTGDVFFHLDPLWADENIDVVGVDWYAPLADWRDGAGHLDAAIARDGHDPAYLAGRIEAGEAYDWYYADAAARLAQERTPIADGAYAEPWIYRAKDVRNFWARAHHDRPGGVRSATPTAWIAQSKPVWFVEIGCPAVDKGANAPNLFLDDKSSESALPPFSSGARDDLIQRRTLEAYLDYWEANNPASSQYDGPMLDPDGVFVWCWDARPFPAYPARDDVWGDGASWRRGHWLSGRAGLATLAEVVREICARAGVGDIDVAGLSGAVSGYVQDSPSTARAALEPLMQAYAFTAAERDGVMVFAHRGAGAAAAISRDHLTADSIGDIFAGRADPAEKPVEARVRFLDSTRDYLVAAVSARRLDSAEGGVESVDAPLVLEPDAAEALAQRVLAERRAQLETARLEVGADLLALEAGDSVELEWAPGQRFEIARIEDAEARRLELRALADAAPGLLGHAAPAAPPHPPFAPTPVFAVLDLPPLTGAEDDERPLAAVFAAPWTGAHELYLGHDAASLGRRGALAHPATMGELLDDLPPGPVGRWDEAARVRVRLYGGALASVGAAAVLEGANAFAVAHESGEWEIVQARAAVLTAPDTYELSGLLRGQQGTEQAMGAPAGARIVKLDASLARLSVSASEWGESVLAAAPPAGAGPADPGAAVAAVDLPHRALRPFAPAHLRARRTGTGDVLISWVRRARAGGDPWAPAEPPLDRPSELYSLEILDGETVVRSLAPTAALYLYSAAEQVEDFALPPAALRVRVAEIGAAGLAGLKTDSTMTL